MDNLLAPPLPNYAELRLEHNHSPQLCGKSKHPQYVVRCSGPWTIHGIDIIGRRLPTFSLAQQQSLLVDASEITSMDTAGAWLLVRVVTVLEQEVRKKGKSTDSDAEKETQLLIIGLHPDHQSLLDLVRRQHIQEEVVAVKINLLERLGRYLINHLEQGYALLVFLGEVTLVVVRILSNPKRLRFKAILHDLQTAGAEALPIVGLISFLMGTVIAYQGGAQLRYYGANLFVVDLVGVTLLRELAPLLTAIIVAGRTGSAYTAQIGTMRVTDEIDALRTIGIDPLELLVIPKILALLLALPLLTAYADILGVLGGMVMAHLVLGVDPHSFLTRFPEAVSVVNYYIGIGKAPVFAAIIAVVGCFQGMRVGDSAEAVGYQVTISVVQAIFLVIVADAIFSVLFSWLNL
ncbi:phospholipid/cholesterol/gamma-HCH transport system permease protein [Gammaproteobacteria bacterium]